MDLVPNSLEAACESVAEAIECASPLCTDSCKAQFPPPGNTKELNECFDACDSALDPDKAADGCIKSVLEGMGCTCPTDEPEDCDCDGSEYQGIDGTWRLLCLALGAVGLIGAVIFTGIPAGVAGWKKIPCINVICFSVCSGIWSLIFIGCGAAFLAISVMLSPAGPWGKEVMNVCPKEEVDLETDMLDETHAEAIDCAAESLCRGIHTILSNLVRTSNAVIFRPSNRVLFEMLSSLMSKTVKCTEAYSMSC